MLPSRFGWVIVTVQPRVRYVYIDGNGEWSWVPSARQAELFRSRESAERYIAANISRNAQAIEHYW